MSGAAGALEPQDWFDEAMQVAEAAPAVSSACSPIGWGSVRLRATSAAAARVAFDGLLLPGDAPSTDTGHPNWVAVDGRDAALPPPPFGPDDVRARDGVAGFSQGRLRIAWALERQVLWALDVKTGRALTWMRDPERCAPWDRSAPWRPILSWWLAEQGAGLVHAAVVAPPDRPDEGILLVGAGGSGKSTLALACASAGWLITGDDYVVARPAAGRWRAEAPYRWAKAAPTTLELLGVPQGWIVPGVDHLGKSLIDLPAAFGARGGAAVSVTAIVAPRVAEGTGEPTALRPAGVVASLGPSTVLQTPGDSSAVLRLVSALAGDLPAWMLEVGPDVASSGPAALAGLLQGVR